MIAPVEPVRTMDRSVWRDGCLTRGGRPVPEETPVALTYNGGTYAVMMATPQDLEDFAVGFSLSEGIVKTPDEIRSTEIVQLEDGIELRMWLASDRASRLNERRRQIAGPTGCGICGIDSIAEAVRPPATVAAERRFSARDIMAATQGLATLQEINIITRAVHAAAFWTETGGIVSLREDVGRHNALDKLAGNLARDGIAAQGGVIVLTSRVSVEMVQKAAVMGVPVIVAISAPTALAIRMAEQAGITLVGIARADGFEIFTHSARIETYACVREPVHVG